MLCRKSLGEVGVPLDVLSRPSLPDALPLDTFETKMAAHYR